MRDFENAVLLHFQQRPCMVLGALATLPDAVKKIFQVKGRPGDNPLIVHVASPADLLILTTGLTSLARSLLQAFAPGPLTLILPRSTLVPDIVTAGLETVAVRIPAHPVARRLIELAGRSGRSPLCQPLRPAQPHSGLACRRRLHGCDSLYH